MLNEKTIAVIGAMDCEINLIKDFLNNVEETENKVFSIFKGAIKDNTVIVAKSGVGKVAAASCTQHIIDKFNPDCIINTGVAGGIKKDLQIGDIIIGDSFIQHDFDVTALGYAKGYVCNGINSKQPTVFHSDKELVEKLQQAISEIIPAEKIHTGRIVSGDRFVADKETKAELRNLFDAVAAEMESAAIAHCASLNNIPFVAIRAISDLADGTKIENYPEFEIQTAKISSNILKTILLK